MKPLFILIILLLVGTLLNATGAVYKDTDEQGNIIYTDRPTDNAERMELPELNIMKTKKVEKNSILPEENNPQTNSQNMTEITTGYFLDNSSLSQQANVTERVRRHYRGAAGPFVYEKVPIESWTFDIIRGGRRIPCMLKCSIEKGPMLESDEDLPDNVTGFIKSNICGRSDPGK